MVFDKTDTKLSSFIAQAQPQDLSAIVSQVFSRVGSLDQRQRDEFIQQIQNDPEARPIFEQMRTPSQ